MLANAPTDGPPTQAFIESYSQLLQWVTDNCGFASLDLVATNYAYGGIADGDQIPAGVTVIRLDNQADEYHEIVLFKRNEGTTESLDELMAMSDDEIGAKLTSVGSGFAAPGTIGGTVADLTPGDYIGLCFIPKGTTQEAMDQMAAARLGTRGQRPDRQRRAASLHARHARRVHGRRGWRSHHRLRRDDDDVDGHDAGHHRLTTSTRSSSPRPNDVPRAAARHGSGSCTTRTHCAARSRLSS